LNSYEYHDVVAGVPFRYEKARTSEAATTGIRLYCGANSGGTAGETIDIYDIVVRPGTSSEFVPSLRIVGDLDMAAKAAAVDWSSGDAQGICDTLDASKGYLFGITPANNQLDFRCDIRSNYSSFQTLTDGQAYEFRVTLDVATGDIIYYRDGIQFDTDSVASGALVASSAQLDIGAINEGTAWPFDGDIEHVIVRDGIGGPAVIDMKAAASGLTEGVIPPGTTWVGADGRTYTAHGGIEYVAPLDANAPDLWIYRYGTQRRFFIGAGLADPIPHALGDVGDEDAGFMYIRSPNG